MSDEARLFVLKERLEEVKREKRWSDIIFFLSAPIAGLVWGIMELSAFTAILLGAIWFVLYAVESVYFNDRKNAMYMEIEHLHSGTAILASKEKPKGPPREVPRELPAGRFCRYCGAPNRNDAVFCEKCGKNIS